MRPFLFPIYHIFIYMNAMVAFCVVFYAFKGLAMHTLLKKRCSIDNSSKSKAPNRVYQAQNSQKCKDNIYKWISKKSYLKGLTKIPKAMFN